MGKSSENRLVVRFSGCGCAMLGLQILWIVGHDFSLYWRNFAGLF